MGSEYTDAQKRASLEYQKKLKQITLKVQPEEKAAFEAAAKANNLPLRQFIILAIEEKIQRDLNDK